MKKNDEKQPVRREDFQDDRKDTGGSANYTKALIDIAKTLKLNEVPQVAELIRRIAIKDDQAAAKKWVRKLARPYFAQQLQPNHFLSTENNLAGEILLGHVGEQPFGVDRQELVRHTLITGGSGFGKSNLLKNIFCQCRERGIFVVHVDRKGDLDHSARDGFDSIRWSALRFNPLCPFDTKVDIAEYRNDFAKLFCDTMQFFQRGLSVFLLGLDAVYRQFHVHDGWHAWNWTVPFPTMLDLLRFFSSMEFRKQVKGQGTESLLSIIDKLHSLIVELEPIVSCQRGFDFVRLYRERRAVNINLDGVSVEYQNFLIVTFLLQFAHYFKAYGPRNELNVLLMFDEAKGILGKQGQNFTIKDLVSKVRELGIGLVCADQIPSEVSQFLFSNVGTLVMFRHSDGFDLQRLQYSSGSSKEQILHNYSLQPGEAIVRSMKSKDLHKIKIPFTPTEKFISRAEVDSLMTARLEELNRDVIPSDANTATVAQPSHNKGNVMDSLDPQERAFLECLAQNFDRPASEVFRQLGLNSSTGYRIQTRLAARRFIKPEQTSLGKDGKRAVFLVPNPVVFDELGIELGSGRGKPLHKHFQQAIKADAEKKGWLVMVEESVDGTSKGPDLGLEKSGRKIALEICVTSKPSTEAANIEKNLKLGFDFVVLSFVSRQAMEKTHELAIQRFQQLVDKARFCLVNDVDSVLKEF